MVSFLLQKSEYVKDNSNQFIFCKAETGLFKNTINRKKERCCFHHFLF